MRVDCVKCFEKIFYVPKFALGTTVYMLKDDNLVPMKVVSMLDSLYCGSIDDMTPEELRTLMNSDEICLTNERDYRLLGLKYLTVSDMQVVHYL